MKSQTTKVHILARAMELFADLGYEATTMKILAASVGIRGPSLYAHFLNKEEIFRSVLDDALLTWKSLVDRIFDEHRDVPGIESGLADLLGDFVREMAGSVAYRFWARIYVFPPPPITDEDRTRLFEMDRYFAGRLEEYCGSRLPSPAAGGSLALLCSSLFFFAMGIMTYAELMDEETMRARMREGVAFHLRALDTTGRAG